MSLGSLFAKRGKAAVIASLPSTPREPLLFLYPRWARTSSTSTSAVSDHIDSSLPSVSHETSVNLSIQRQSADSLANSTFEQDALHGQEAFVGGTGRLSEDEPKIRQIQTTWDKIIEAQRLVENERKAKHDAAHRRGVRMVYQASRRKLRGSWEPDWRVILSDLMQHTSSHTQWLDKALVILVPEDAVPTLLYGIDDNIWEIGIGYECAIELQDRDTTDGHANFLLSGSATAISKTAAHILQIAPHAKMNATNKEIYQPSTRLPSAKVTQINTSSNINSDGLPSVHDGRARYSMQRKPRIVPVTRADRVPKPKEWTKRNFADYIEDLTSSKVPNHLHRLMYKRQTDHITTVVEILRKIFIDPECRPSLTREAFNMAIAYFEKTNRVEDARIFFVHMEMMKIPMNVETFNILLRGTAKNEDLHSFHFILHLMLKRNISPNSKTWIAFLMALHDLKIKLYTWSKMKELGLLRHRSTIKDACEQIVSNEISTSLDSSQSQAEFLSHMDSRYGPSWLTTDGSARIIHALGGRGLISRCWDFLFVMNDRQLKINDYCINTTLNHCKQNGNVMGAIEFLRSLPPFVQVEPDEMTYHVLFQLAWRAKSYNLAKVVWRYACLNAATTRMMRKRVLISLRNSHLINEPDQNHRFYFGHSVGQFISSDMDYWNHPAVVIQREFKNLVGFEMLEDPLEMHVPEKTRIRKNLFAKQIHSPTPENKDSEKCRESQPTSPGLQPENLAITPENTDFEYYEDDKTLSSKALDPTVGLESKSSGPSQENDIPYPGSKPIDLKAASEIRDDIYSHDIETPLSESTAATVTRTPVRPILNFMNHEGQVFQWWRPTRRLADMMLEAWEMDEEWKNPQDYEKRSKIRDMKWKIDNSISIPIRAHIGTTPVKMDWR